MERGDLIRTPRGPWHKREHTDTDPVIGLDVLDLALVYYAETSCAVDGKRQAVQISYVNPETGRDSDEPVSLGNRSTMGPAFPFIADESPLHRKLGVYETRA